VGRNKTLKQRSGVVLTPEEKQFDGEKVSMIYSTVEANTLEIY
jgi:hypothetical protein